MFSLILVSVGKVAAFVVAALIVGGILAYSFRGKEHAALDEVGNEAKKVVDNVEKHL